MATVIVTIIVIILMALSWAFGLFEILGFQLLRHCFPVTYPTKGSQVDIYINGTWNRRATVTSCCHSYIVLYDAVRCPVDHRGNFYAIGEDANGNELVYVDDARHWHMVKRAEWVRKIFNTPEDYATFTPFDDNRSSDDVFSGVKYAADEETETIAEDQA